MTRYLPLPGGGGHCRWMWPSMVRSSAHKSIALCDFGVGGFLWGMRCLLFPLALLPVGDDSRLAFPGASRNKLHTPPSRRPERPTTQPLSGEQLHPLMCKRASNGIRNMLRSLVACGRATARGITRKALSTQRPWTTADGSWLTRPLRPWPPGDVGRRRTLS